MEISYNSTLKLLEDFTYVDPEIARQAVKLLPFAKLNGIEILLIPNDRYKKTQNPGINSMLIESGVTVLRNKTNTDHLRQEEEKNIYYKHAGGSENQQADDKTYLGEWQNEQTNKGIQEGRTSRTQKKFHCTQCP